LRQFQIKYPRADGGSIDPVLPLPKFSLALHWSLYRQLQRIDPGLDQAGSF